MNVFLPLLGALTFAPTAQAAAIGPVAVNGELTIMELADIRSDRARLNAIKAAARADGRITRAEAAQIQRLEAQLTQQTKKYLNNRADRY